MAWRPRGGERALAGDGARLCTSGSCRRCDALSPGNSHVPEAAVSKFPVLWALSLFQQENEGPMFSFLSTLNLPPQRGREVAALPPGPPGGMSQGRAVARGEGLEAALPRSALRGPELLTACLVCTLLASP